MTPPVRTGLFRFVRWSQVQDYLRRGWMVVGDLGEPHGVWSVLMWRCTEEGCEWFRTERKA